VVTPVKPIAWFAERWEVICGRFQRSVVDGGGVRGPVYSPIDYDGKTLDNHIDGNTSKRIIGCCSPVSGTAEPEMRGLYILITLNIDGGMEVLKYVGRLSVEQPNVFSSKPVQLALKVYKASRNTRRTWRFRTKDAVAAYRPTFKRLTNIMYFFILLRHASLSEPNKRPRSSTTTPTSSLYCGRLPLLTYSHASCSNMSSKCARWRFAL